MQIPKLHPLQSSNRFYSQKIQPALKTPKAQAYSMLILSFFTMAFFGFFAIRPTLRTIAQLNREIHDSKELDQKLTDKIKALSLIQSDYELISGAIQSLDDALPRTAQLPSILSAVEDIARQTNASISAFTVGSVEIASVSAKTSNQSVQEIQFAVTFAGTYEQIVEAMRLLITNRRIVHYDSAAFAMHEDEGKASTLTVTLGAKSFYY